MTQEDVDYLLGIVNNRFPEAHITIDDIESSWAGLRPLISGNSASDYNGGNNGTISDESFNALIATVEGYLSKEKSREDVESAISHLEGSTSENTWIHLLFLVDQASIAMTMVSLPLLVGRLQTTARWLKERWSVS